MHRLRRGFRAHHARGLCVRLPQPQARPRGGCRQVHRLRQVHPERLPSVMLSTPSIQNRKTQGRIGPVTCVGCGVCSQICPVQAISGPENARPVHANNPFSHHRRRRGQEPFWRATCSPRSGCGSATTRRNPTSSGWPCAAPWSAISSGAARSRAHDDEGSADYYISFEWLEGLRRMAYQPGHRDPRQRLAHRSRGGQLGSGRIPAVEGIRNTMRERCAALHVLPAAPWPWIWATPVYSTASSWASCPCSWAGTGTFGAPPWRTPSPQGTRPERQGLRRRAFLRAVGHPRTADPHSAGRTDRIGGSPAPLGLPLLFCEASHV